MLYGLTHTDLSSLDPLAGMPQLHPALHGGVLRRDHLPPHREKYSAVCDAGVVLCLMLARCCVRHCRGVVLVLAVAPSWCWLWGAGCGAASAVALPWCLCDAMCPDAVYGATLVLSGTLS